jgi:gamma-glutamylputrescine oxidase
MGGTIGADGSFWTRGLPQLGEAFPGGAVTVDCAVIGAGFTGLSAALHILRDRPGCRVAVLEAGHVGAGASGRNTGMVTPGVGQNLLALVRRIGHDRARALYQATLDGVQYVEALVREERIDCQFHRSGQLIIARGGPGRARLAALAGQMEHLGLGVQRLDDAALADHVRLGYVAPASAAGPAGLRLPIAGTLHPGRLLEGLARRVQALGGRIYERAGVLAIGTGRPVRLTLADGEVITPHVVAAVAGFAHQLGLLRGRILPVQLQALATAPLTEEDLATLHWSGREGVVDSRRIFDYFRLTADDRLIFGGGRPRYAWVGRERPSIAAAALERLTAALRDALPAAVRPRVEAAWTGTIAYALDALPVIGRLLRRPEILFAGGWCGHGVSLSLSAGAWIAHILRHGAPPNDLPWFRGQATYVPFEPVRWTAFRASIGAMAALDQRA